MKCIDRSEEKTVNYETARENLLNEQNLIVQSSEEDDQLLDGDFYSFSFYLVNNGQFVFEKQ